MAEPLFLNWQFYQECQLVTAINAAFFLGEPLVEQGTPEYERLVDFVHARNGAAISIEKAHEYLKIKRTPLCKKAGFTWELMKQKIDEGHPVELLVQGPKYGRHSVLAVECRKEAYELGEDPAKLVKIANFGLVANKYGLIKYSKLRAYMRFLDKVRPVAWYFYKDPLHIRRPRLQGEPEVPFVAVVHGKINA